jgi:hypothetical protein
MLPLLPQSVVAAGIGYTQLRYQLWKTNKAHNSKKDQLIRDPPPHARTILPFVGSPIEMGTDVLGLIREYCAKK